MDLALHFRVLSRHRALVAVGLLVAVALAFLSYFKIGSDGLEYRKQEQWRSITRLFAAQGGYPFKPVPSTTAAVDPTTFAVLASEFVTSDAVKRLLRRKGAVEGRVDAGPLKDNNDEFLPFIEVAGIATSPSDAQALARRAAAAISTYVQQRQAENGVPEKRRITLQVVSQPNEPELLQGRPKGATMFLFLAIVSITIGLAYVLENVRGPSSQPRPSTVDDTESSEARAASETDDDDEATTPAPPVPLTLPDRGARARPDDEKGRRPTLSLDSKADKGASERGALPRADER